jgi:hypothetical protein
MSATVSGSAPVLSGEADPDLAYEIVVTEPGNTAPDDLCRYVDWCLRGALDGQIEWLARKKRFSTDARNQCSAGTDILDLPGQDALRTLDRDRVLEGDSFAFPSLITIRMIWRQRTFLICSGSQCNRITRAIFSRYSNSHRSSREGHMPPDPGFSDFRLLSRLGAVQRPPSPRKILCPAHPLPPRAEGDSEAAEKSSLP